MAYVHNIYFVFIGMAHNAELVYWNRLVSDVFSLFYTLDLQAGVGLTMVKSNKTK